MANGEFRVVFPMEYFDGGLNNKYAQNAVHDSESPDCQNVVFTTKGGVKTRGGMAKFNTTAVGSFAGDGLFAPQFNDGTSQLVGWWNGTAYKCVATTFTTIASGQSVYTAGEYVDAAMYQNYMFFGNGYSKPYKWNGTEFTRHGVPQPNSGPSDTSGTAGANGASTGDVNYKVSYVNSALVEGDVSAATTTLTLASSASVSLTSIPLAPTSFGVGARRLYRRDSGSAGSYKLVTTLSDNTTTTYLDATPAASLGATAPTDNAEPPLWQYVVKHQERLWFATPNSSVLWYSELANPYVVKTTNFILIGDGDGERITGLAVYSNMVVIFKEASIWFVIMEDTTPGNWKRAKSNSKYGGASHYGQADFLDRRMFLGKRYQQLTGYYNLAGGDVAPNGALTGVGAAPRSETIEPEVFNFNPTYAIKSCGIEFKNILYFSVPYTTSTINNRTYTFDFNKREGKDVRTSWVPQTYPVGFSRFAVFGNQLLGQTTSATGRVYKLDQTSFTDDGTAIDSYYWTKEFHGHDEHRDNWKDFRKLNFIAETLGAYYMGITYRVDSDSGVGTTQQLYLGTGATVWGSFTWGASVWGAGNARINATIGLGGVQGKRIQYKFDNRATLNHGFHVYPQAQFSYNVRGKR